MFEKILVPLDTSELAEVVLPYAEELAGRLGAEITLVHVCESLKTQDYHLHHIYMQKMAELIKQGAERYSKESVKKSIKVKPTILLGSPAEEIVEYANNEDFSLIVMATHGKSGIGRWTLGSVTNKVVRATKQPIALIRAKGASPDVRDKGILNRALVPLDGSKESEIVIPYIEELASELKAEVVLFHAIERGYHTITVEGFNYVIYTDQQMEGDKTFAEEYLDKVGAQLKQKGVTTKSEVRFGSPSEEIIKLADEVRADFVAMSTYRHSGIARWTFGSVADKVLHEGNTPLLLVRA